MLTRDPKLPGLEETIREQVDALAGLEMLVGLPGQKAAPGVSSASELVTIARAIEYGTATIPPRKFLRTALMRHRRRWTRGLAKIVPLAGQRGPMMQVIHKVGIAMVADTQSTMRKGPWTPNAPSTIARKGSSQPLIDSAQLIQSIRALLRVHGRDIAVIG